MVEYQIADRGVPIGPKRAGSAYTHSPARRPCAQYPNGPSSVINATKLTVNVQCYTLNDSRYLLAAQATLCALPAKDTRD